MKKDIEFLEALYAVMCRRRDGYTTGLIKAAQHGGFILMHSWEGAQYLRQIYGSLFLPPSAQALKGLSSPLYLDREFIRQLLAGYLDNLKEVEKLKAKIAELETTRDALLRKSERADRRALKYQRSLRRELKTVFVLHGRLEEAKSILKRSLKHGGEKVKS